MKKVVLIILVTLSLSLVGCGTTSPIEKYRSYTAEQLYTTSEAALAKRHYREAVTRLEALNVFYPFGPYSEQGMLDLIYAYYVSSQKPSALAVADRFVRLYPRSPNAAYAYYMKGLINFTYGETWLQRWMSMDPSAMDMSAKQQAFADFSQIVYLHPNSIYAPAAAQYMIYIRNILARKQVLIAQFYYMRKAYVAAANRASYVIVHFPGSPDTIEALVILVKCYRKMHLYDLADNTMKILIVNFPDSPEVQRLAKGYNH